MAAIRHALPPLLAAVFWGGMYVVSKWGFASIPPLTLAFLRVAVGAVVLAAVVYRWSPKRSFSRGDWRAFLVLGGWVALTLVTQFVGTDLTTASQGSLLTVLTPVFTLVFGVLLLEEALNARRTIGMAVAAIGTGVVLWGRYEFSSLLDAELLGVLSLLAAGISWAAFTVYGTPFVRKYSALETATYATLFSVPMLAVLAGVELVYLEPDVTIPITVGTVGAVLYLGVFSTAAAWYLWYRGVEHLSAGTVAVFFFAQPVVGSLFGALLLGEVLGAPFLGGGLVMAAGVYLVSSSE